MDPDPLFAAQPVNSAPSAPQDMAPESPLATALAAEQAQVEAAVRTADAAVRTAMASVAQAEQSMTAVADSLASLAPADPAVALAPTSGPPTTPPISDLQQAVQDALRTQQAAVAGAIRQAEAAIAAAVNASNATPDDPA